MEGSGKAIDTGTELLLGDLRDGVATLTLNRPEARNALSDELTPALRRMIARVGNDPSVGALVLTGAGAAFCAGGDVKGMGGDPARERTTGEKVLDLQQRQRTLTGVLVGLPIPTIAALPGPAAGAGLAIALACDIRFAAASAFVTTGYARVGLSGDYGINWLLTRLVGTARARELMFTADRVDAETCARIGLVNRVFADESLRSETAAFRCPPRRRTQTGARPDEAQPRPRADLRLPAGPRQRGGTAGPRRSDRGPQGSGPRLHREAARPDSAPERETE